MARRLDKTLADYLVIAVSPALIITLIGSLVFFLVQICYSGQHEIRLHLILALFILAAVLVGRISIEEGAERAALFAVPLGLVTLWAVHRFVQIHGPLAPLSDVINCGLIGLIWWSAHKLTWDCTMIDETEPDAGEGLLESAGLDKSAAAARREADQAREPDGTTARDPLPTGWWARWVQRRRRPHAPGVWVVYFSLAALPLFGLGQLFLAAENLAGRRYAFSLLGVYVASGLGLLLTTSFLGLRRYLRQRRLPMPMLMANTWIVLGGVLIVAVMGLALLLPRPNAEYAVSQLPFTLGSPDQHTSPYAVDGSGVEEEQLWSRAAAEDRPDETRPDRADGEGKAQAGKQQGETESPSGEPAGKGQSQGGKADAQSGKAENRSSSSSRADQRSDDEDQSRPRKSDAQKQPGPGARDAERANAGAKSQDQPTPKPDDAARQQPRRGGRGSASSAGKARPDKARDAAASSPRDAGRGGGGQTPPPSVPHLGISRALAEWLPLLKWIFYGGLVLLAAWWLWRARAELLAALHGLLEGWGPLWRALFGWRRRKAAMAAVEDRLKRPSFRPFVTYADPFASGDASRYSADELVRYTFEAVEAWAREHDCARPPEQTPHEFARAIGQRAAALAEDALQLADLYCQVAYAPGRLATSGVAPLAHLWQKMRAEAFIAT